MEVWCYVHLAKYVAGSLLGAMSSPTMCSWPYFQYQVWVSTHGTGLKSKQKTSGCPHDSHTTITPVVYLAHLVIILAHRAHSWVKLLMNFLPQQRAKHLPVLCKSANRKKASVSVPAGFPMSYYQGVRNNVSKSHMETCYVISFLEKNKRI